MSFKGFDCLIKHVPNLRSPVRSAFIALAVLFFFGLPVSLFIMLDYLWPEWTLVGQFATLMTGFFLVSQFFNKRKEFMTRWGEMAYRNAFGRYVLTGLPLVFAVVAHIGYMPGALIPQNWWTLGIVTLGWYFYIIGTILLIRAIFTFGTDNLAMLYVYFPKEGRMVDSAIYGILRHPVYAGIVRIGLGLSLINGNWFAIAFGLFMPIGLTLWLRLVEEQELIERFGQGYADYRKEVPAFWPRIQDWRRYWQFLLIGK